MIVRTAEPIQVHDRIRAADLDVVRAIATTTRGDDDNDDHPAAHDPVSHVRFYSSSARYYRGTSAHGSRWLVAVPGRVPPPILRPRPTPSHSISTAKLATGETYWDLPYPSDLRLAADGTVDFTGFPNRRNLPVVDDLLAGAKRRAGFPVMPIAYVKFTDAAPQLDLTQIAAGARILDIDAASPERGTTYPVVAQTLATDDYTGKNLVALAPYPGIVLRASTRYAFVLDKSFAPDTAVPDQFSALADGSSANAKATALYAPLWPLVDKSNVLVATVFTTGDEVSVLQQRSEALRAAHHVTIDNLQVDPTDGAMHDGYCELIGTVTFPQFQTRNAAVRSRRYVRV